MTIAVATDRGIIELSGRDSMMFLQNITSNDVSLLSGSNPCQYSLFLSKDGRILYDAFIFRQEGEVFLLDVPLESIEDIMAHMRSYKLRSKVAIRHLQDLCVILASGEGEFISKSNSAATTNEIAPQEIVSLSTDPRCGDILPYVRAISTIQSSNSFTKMDSADLYHGMNFLHKIPFFAHDFISNEVFPFEINLHSALNYSKGCYIGQEVITRTKFRGAVRKGIYRVAIDCAKTSSFARNKLLYTNSAGKEKSAGRLLGEYTKYMSTANNPRKYSASDSDFARGNDIQMDSNSAFHAAATSTAPLSILNSRQPLDIGMQNCQNSTENTLLSQTSHNTSAHTLINMNVSTDNEQQSDHTEQNIAHPADVIPIDVHINASPQSIDLHKSGEHGDSSEVTRKYFLALISDSAIASIDSLKIANSE